PVERRDRPDTDEVRVCAPRTRRPYQKTEGRPDGAVTEDMAHLVENDLAEVTAREQARDVRCVEAHDADSRSVARSADDTGTRLAEHLAGPVDRIELDENDDVINRLVDYRRAGPACSSPEGHCDVGDVAVDQPLPLHFGAVEHLPLRGGGGRAIPHFDLIRTRHARRAYGGRVPGDGAGAHRRGEHVGAQLYRPASDAQIGSASCR